MIYPNANVTRMLSNVVMSPEGVDRTFQASAVLSNGVLTSSSASMLCASPRLGIIQGTKGYIIVGNINNPEYIDVYAADHTLIQRITPPKQLTGYEYEVAAAAQAVLDAADPWLTPMAAVAGTLSDAVADYLWDQGAEKVIVNNGGDIALRLAPGQRLGLGVRYDLSRDSIDRVIHLDRDTKVGGVATSGLGGRSLTTGIASGVTVFASRCAMADALATLLADRSYLELPAVHTRPAEEIDPDTDIAGQKVVVKVDPLTREQRRKALAQILDEAQRQYCRGHLIACIATVQGESASFDPADILKS